MIEFIWQAKLFWSLCVDTTRMHVFSSNFRLHKWCAWIQRDCGHQKVNETGDQAWKIGKQSGGKICQLYLSFWQLSEGTICGLTTSLLCLCLVCRDQELFLKTNYHVYGMAHCLFTSIFLKWSLKICYVLNNLENDFDFSDYTRSRVYYLCGLYFIHVSLLNSCPQSSCGIQNLLLLCVWKQI